MSQKCFIYIDILTTSASGGDDNVQVPRYTNIISNIGAIHCSNCLSVNFSLWADFTRYVKETLKSNRISFIQVINAFECCTSYYYNNYVLIQSQNFMLRLDVYINYEFSHLK